MEGTKIVVYIAGPVTGVAKYWEAFEQAEDDLTACGCIPLSPARLPEGMTNAQYMRTCFAMIDSADAVLFLPDSDKSKGARLERDYCAYVKKPMMTYREFDSCGGRINPREARLHFIKFQMDQMEEVFGE